MIIVHGVRFRQIPMDNDPNHSTQEILQLNYTCARHILHCET